MSSVTGAIFLYGRVVKLRPLAADDLDVLRELLFQPHVARWWHPNDDLSEYLEVDGTHRFLAEADDRVVGYGQWYRWTEEWAGHYGIPVGTVGIDYLIGFPFDCERGLGTALVAALVDAADPVDIWVTPEEANGPSCRVLEKNGFELMAVKQCHVPDEPWAGPTALYRLTR